MQDTLVVARNTAASADPKLAPSGREFCFYDLQAKAADDVADTLDVEGASNLLGHTNVRTTKKHYLRKGRSVGPTN